MTRWLNADEQATWRAWLTAISLLGDALDRQLRQDAGIPHSYYEVLVHLSESPEHRMRMSELADRSLSSRSRLSHAVARLEEMGWVRREACADDRRGQLAVLTDVGFEALREAAPGHVETVRRLWLDPLSGDQVCQLRGIVEAIAAAVEDAEAADDESAT